MVRPVVSPRLMLGAVLRKEGSIWLAHPAGLRMQALGTAFPLGVPSLELGPVGLPFAGALSQVQPTLGLIP
jgi:hypothetical protein